MTSYIDHTEIGSEKSPSEIRLVPPSPSVLMIGLFSSARSGNWSDCIDISHHLESIKWNVITTSARLSRAGRIADIIWTLLRYRREYQIAQVDVYSGNAFLWCELSSILLKLLGKPFVLTLHGGNLPKYSQKRAKRVQRVLNLACSVTVPSSYLLYQMIPYCDRLRFLPSPLKLDEYKFRVRTRPKCELVWLRSFHHLYNPPMAIRALEKLREFPFEPRLSMYGADKGDGTLENVNRMIWELGLDILVSVNEPIPKAKVPNILQNSDIFINTTNVDNTPISVIEAMACGLCIVSTNVGGIPYLLTHEHDALLVPPNDAEAMANAVRRILTEPGLAERLSRNARATAEQFDWSVVMPQWEALLTSAIMEHRHGRKN